MGARKTLLRTIFRKRLVSAYDSKQFSRCAECKAELLVSGRPFIVTKDYNYGEVVMEYAVCVDCNERHQLTWSDGSRNKVSELYRDAAGAQSEWEPVVAEEEVEMGRGEVPFEDADAEFADSAGVPTEIHHLEGPFDRCWLTGSEIPVNQPFQIVTMVQSPEEDLRPSSILLSYEGLERIQSVLSKQTRDERDRYREQVYPRVPPDWEDLPDFSDPELLHVGPGSSSSKYL